MKFTLAAPGPQPPVMGDPLATVHAALEAADCDPSKFGAVSVRARCPACGEHNRYKLLVSRGDRAPLRITCFAGCPWDRVLDALGLEPGIALNDSERDMLAHWELCEAESIRHARAAVAAAAEWVERLGRGEAVGPSPSGPLRLAARLTDDAARRVRGVTPVRWGR